MLQAQGKLGEAIYAASQMEPTPSDDQETPVSNDEDVVDAEIVDDEDDKPTDGKDAK